MKNPIIALFAVLICAFSLQARTPQEIKAVLQSICPRDTILKAAYLKDGTPSNFARDATKGNVYVVSSEDGIVRKVNTVTGDLIMANITADGKRVLFHDRKTARTYKVDWDGKNETLISTSGFLVEYWRDRAAGTDWAVMESNGQYRINIDNPTVGKVQLSQYGVSGLSGGLSDDGTRIVVWVGSWGSAAVGSSSVQKGSGGCQTSMRAGPLNQWSCNESGHGSVFVNNPNGSVAFKIRMGPNGSGEGARFTQHPNYFTYMVANQAADGVARPQPVNPIIMRISDSTRIGIEDNVAKEQWCGDVDVVFLPATTGVSKEEPRAYRACGRNADLRAQTFTVAGRRLSGVAAETGAARGVVVLRINGATPALVRAALVD